MVTWFLGRGKAIIVRRIEFQSATAVGTQMRCKTTLPLGSFWRFADLSKIRHVHIAIAKDLGSLVTAFPEAIATVVTVAEILKNNGLAVEKRILTSTVDMKDETRDRPIQKAKVEILLAKADKFDELMAAA